MIKADFYKHFEIGLVDNDVGGDSDDDDDDERWPDLFYHCDFCDLTTARMSASECVDCQRRAGLECGCGKLESELNQDQQAQFDDDDSTKKEEEEEEELIAVSTSSTTQQGQQQQFSSSHSSVRKRARQTKTFDEEEIDDKTSLKKQTSTASSTQSSASSSTTSFQQQQEEQQKQEEEEEHQHRHQEFRVRCKWCRGAVTDHDKSVGPPPSRGRVFGLLKLILFVLEPEHDSFWTFNVGRRMLQHMKEAHGRGRVLVFGARCAATRDAWRQRLQLVRRFASEPRLFLPEDVRLDDDCSVSLLIGTHCDDGGGALSHRGLVWGKTYTEREPLKWWLDEIQKNAMSLSSISIEQEQQQQIEKELNNDDSSDATIEQQEDDFEKVKLNFEF